MLPLFEIIVGFRLGRSTAAAAVSSSSSSSSSSSFTAAVSTFDALAASGPAVHFRPPLHLSFYFRIWPEAILLDAAAAAAAAVPPPPSGFC